MKPVRPFSQCVLTILLIADPFQVRWLEAATGRLVRQTPKSKEYAFRHLTLAPNARILAELEEMTCILRDAADGSETARIEFGGPLAYGIGVAFSPDSTVLVVSDSSGRTRFVDVATAEERFSACEPSFRPPVVFSPNGRHLATGGREILIWSYKKMLKAAAKREVEEMKDE